MSNTTRRGFILGAAAATLAGKASAIELRDVPMSHSQLSAILNTAANNEAGQNTALVSDYGVPLHGKLRTSNGLIVQYHQNGARDPNPCDIYVVVDEASCGDAGKVEQQQSLIEATRYFQSLDPNRIRYVSSYYEDNSPCRIDMDWMDDDNDTPRRDTPRPEPEKRTHQTSGTDRSARTLEF